MYEPFIYFSILSPLDDFEKWDVLDFLVYMYITHCKIWKNDMFWYVWFTRLVIKTNLYVADLRYKEMLYECK